MKQEVVLQSPQTSVLREPVGLSAEFRQTRSLVRLDAHLVTGRQGVLALQPLLQSLSRQTGQAGQQTHGCVEQAGRVRGDKADGVGNARISQHGVVSPSACRGTAGGVRCDPCESAHYTRAPKLHKTSCEALKCR